MPSARTKPSTRRLSEVARYVIAPTGIVSTGYPGVRDKCAQLGIVHDDWQQDLGRLVLAKRKDGKYAATVGGVVISIPRQVGKTFTVGSIIFALCLLFPGMTVLWTAHRTRTSNETFRALQGMARRSKVRPFVRTIRQANGEQEISFHNGSRILFGAREQGFGRGFAEVDIEVFDEGQILTERALEDMVAATNQAKHPAGALLFYMGTPPRPVDPGEVFRNKRAKALAGQSTDMVYVELSADATADPDDRKQWAKANPSYPKRTPVESMMRLRENVGSDESFMREGLGVWDEDGTPGVFGPGWPTLATKGSVIADQLTFAVAVSLDRKRYAIGAAGVNADGLVHVELTHEPGSSRAYNPKAAVAECKRLTQEHRARLVIDSRGTASSLVPLLKEAGVDLVEASASDICDAYADMYDRVQARDLVHLGDAELDATVAAAKTRTIGDRLTLARRSSDCDTSPAEAVMLAAWPVEKRPPEVLPLIEYR